MKFLSVYAIITTIVYAAIPYKTPWCMLSIVFPFWIIAGYCCNVAWLNKKTKTRYILLSTFVIATSYSSYRAYMLYSTSYCDAKEKYVYVHTLKASMDAIAPIKNSKKKLTGIIGIKDSSPIPWLLGDNTLQYETPPKITQPPDFIICSAQWELLLSNRFGPLFKKQRFFLRPYKEEMVIFWR